MKNKCYINVKTGKISLLVSSIDSFIYLIYLQKIKNLIIYKKERK